MLELFMVQESGTSGPESVYGRVIIKHVEQTVALIYRIAGLLKEWAGLCNDSNALCFLNKLEYISHYAFLKPDLG